MCVSLPTAGDPVAVVPSLASVLDHLSFAVYTSSLILDDHLIWFGRLLK